MLVCKNSLCVLPTDTLFSLEIIHDDDDDNILFTKNTFKSVTKILHSCHCFYCMSLCRGYKLQLDCLVYNSCLFVTWFHLWKQHVTKNPGLEEKDICIEIHLQFTFTLMLHYEDSDIDFPAHTCRTFAYNGMSFYIPAEINHLNTCHHSIVTYSPLTEPLLFFFCYDDFALCLCERLLVLSLYSALLHVSLVFIHCAPLHMPSWPPLCMSWIYFPLVSLRNIALTSFTSQCRLLDVTRLVPK